MVLHLLLGDQPLFHVPAYQLVNPFEFLVYAVLGLVGGLASVCFVKLLLYLRIWFRRLPQSTVWLQPAAGGLLVGILGWFIPEVLGVGYDYVDRVLSGNFPIRTVVILLVLKLIATPVCYSSGNAGGIFGPSLFIGAMIGGATGGIAHMLFPHLTGTPGAYALVGMGTAFAGIVRTPLTSVIMIFEMTRDYAIIVPLMISNLISFFVSRQLQAEPIYEALALQEGVYLPTGESREERTGTRVGEIMDREATTIPFDADLTTAGQMLDERKCNAWPAGERHVVRGIVRSRQIATAEPDAVAVEDVVTADDYPFVHPDHRVSVALERMRDTGVDALPAVSRANIHELKGVITLARILEMYGVGERDPANT
jgi:CIC family chloride channel protein